MTRYTPIPSAIILTKHFNERIFHTYCLIMEKCWNPDTGNFEWSEPVSMSMMAKEIGKPRTTLMEHIGVLVKENMIQKYSYNDIAFALIPTVTVGQPTGVSASRPITIKTLSIKKEALSELKKKDVGQPTGVGEPTVDAEIVEFLRQSGVGEPTRSKIAASGKPFDYIVDWFRNAELKDQPVGYAIAAIRDNLPAPEYCSLCHGIEGKHKIVLDEFSGPLMCPREDCPEMSIEDIVEVYGVIQGIPPI